MKETLWQCQRCGIWLTENKRRIGKTGVFCAACDDELEVATEQIKQKLVERLSALRDTLKRRRQMSNPDEKLPPDTAEGMIEAMEKGVLDEWGLRHIENKEHWDDDDKEYYEEKARLEEESLGIEEDDV